MTRKHDVMMAALALAIGLAVAGDVSAAALAGVRDTPRRSGDARELGVASNATIFAGAMVAVNTSGYAVPASDTAGLRVVGRAEESVDNSGTAGDGALSIAVRRGVFRWENGDTLTIADVGNLAYVEDDQTVQTAASATHDVVAGIIIDVDSDGAWVDTYAVGGQGAASLATLSTAGAASIGGTLAVAGVATFSAAPKLSVATSAGTETVTMTNAPAAGDPVWMDITYGAETFVVPLFPKE
jgi:exosome complex RNA-binding protein Csl4